MVTVSERNVQLNDWNGVGYIVLDPITSSGAYMIDWLSGGSLTYVTATLQNLINSGQMTKDEAKQFIMDNRSSIWFPAPVDGPINSKFQTPSRPNHDGLDFAVPNWVQVSAVASGKVTRAEFSSSYGNVIYIKHGALIETRYAHNCELLVFNGQEVSEGQVIAKSGNTGHIVSGGKDLPPNYPLCSD